MTDHRTSTTSSKKTDIVFFDPAIARAARAYTGLVQRDFAQMAEVTTRTVFKLEDDGHVTRETLDRVLRVLSVRGVILDYDATGDVTGLKFVKRPGTS